MSAPEVGKKVPDFSLPGTDGEFRLADVKGKKHVILYFYPKDNTPGCTSEGQDFRDRHARIQALDAIVLGVSRDSLRAHTNFKAKHDFPFQLLSDADEKLCRSFDVIKEKNMYGRKVLGIERSTFLIDKQGKLVREWRKVKVAGHADTVLEALESL
jgi:peroxiredoxin Q/BCP